MNLQGIKNRIKKILAYTVTAILFLLISSFLILQMPPVQNYLIGKFLGDFTRMTGFPTTIENFHMLWFDRLELEHVSVYDPAGNKMISAKQILINFKLSQLIEDRNVNIDGVYLDSAHVFLTKIDESDSSRDLNINVFIANINAHYAGSGGGGKAPKINIGEAFVNESQFTFVNQDHDSIKSGFDYNHFSLGVDEGQLEGFFILGDTTEFNLKTLIAQDLQSKFTVKQISTYFRICQTSMEFVGLDLQTGRSTVRDTVIFKYKALRDLNYIYDDNVRLHANLHNTTIDPRDLALFMPGVERIQQPFLLDGIFNGRLNKFKFTQMKVDIGNSHLAGSLDMDGLPNIMETFMIVNLKNSLVDPRDFSFLFNDNTMDRLLPMGKMVMDGQFLGYPNDFVAKGKFSGKLGVINSDINLKVNEADIDHSEYSGRLSLDRFKLGVYLRDTATFQTVSMNGQVRGKGLTQHTADFKLDGKVFNLGFRGYDYKNIQTNARFASERFNGFVKIDDPNLQIEARGSVDLREGKNQIIVQAVLDTAFLHKLKLTRDSIFLHANIVADIQGLTLDSLVGTADLKDFQIDYNHESLSLETIHLNAQRTKDERSFILETSLADAEVRGNYYFSDLYRDIQTLSKEISLNIKNNEQATRNYYRKKNYRPKSYQAKINIKIKDIDPLVPVLRIPLELSKNTTIDGTFTSGYTTIFQGYTHFDTLRYKDVLFLKTEVDFTASKIADSTSVLAMATVNSQEQEVNKNLKTKALLLEAIWNKSHIDFNLDADQQGQSNYVRLKGAVDFLQDSTMLSMDPSVVKVLEREWHFAPNNRVLVKDKDWSFHDLALQNEDQSIDLHGKISEDPSKLLSLSIDKLDLSLLNVLTNLKFTGVMDAQVDMSNYYKNPSLQNSISIHDLTIDKFLIGDITGRNQWDTTQNKFDIDLFIDRMDKRILNVTGNYTPSDKTSPLNILAKLENANLKIVEPFLQDIFSNIGGTISGDFTITGPLESPVFEGEGTMHDGQIMINYLKTLYAMTGHVGLTHNSIYFKDIELTDAFKNKGKLKGAISHRDFRDMSIAMDATFKNLQVLNTTLKDNSLFYGQAYASGDLNFSGPLSNLKITSSARTEKNTRVYVPIGGTSSTDQKEFINFVNFTDTTFTKKIEKHVSKKVNLTGITFDLNLDVTPDAYCEIIFDLKAGDIIRGRGNGELRMQMDTKGEFNMYGPFEFTEGWYNFTLYDIINKEFEIQKGSRITWFGDPYQAVMDINASYNQLASLLPLVNDPSVANSPQLRRKYPVQVLLALTGPMLSPLINFDIVAKDLPQNVITENGAVNLNLQFTAFKNKLDEQELKRQVFSLIVLRRFSPPESFNTSGSVVSSLSELLSNQLSYWMSQVDENLEIDVDIASMDQESFNTFQLRFSYTFMNGRLRVTGDGTFNNATQNTNGTQPNPSNVAGDWTVDYKLTADGKLRVKMYSRTNTNPILSSVNNQTAMTTGASLIHTQSFDEVRDLFRSSRKRKKNEQENAQLNKDALKPEDGTD
ncbi:translocation/assembly module TamB domain-containing protein [Chryseolinea lacunae]|uniref:Translocation/assembly module TamB n=1 Tax=Chryseolinea lacunae TaxID=2801331 RepID=A0ABS1L113_9BACT|nr:translocation/assembly module TamB domain-containing protein [Chryseolinea lacunae]MBL0745394.1 translocation/assembly module TamB [Chryseolinea lacunae]